MAPQPRKYNMRTSLLRRTHLPQGTGLPLKGTLQPQPPRHGDGGLTGPSHMLGGAAGGVVSGSIPPWELIGKSFFTWMQQMSGPTGQSATAVDTANNTVQAQETTTPKVNPTQEYSLEDDFVIEDSPSEEELEEGQIDDWSSLYCQDEQLGPALPEAAANLANKALRAPMPAAREKALTDKYLRPDNAPGLQVPKVNPEIWRSVSRRTKENDVCFQRCSHTSTRA